MSTDPDMVQVSPQEEEIVEQTEKVEEQEEEEGGGGGVGGKVAEIVHEPVNESGNTIPAATSTEQSDENLEVSGITEAAEDKQQKQQQEEEEKQQPEKEEPIVNEEEEDEEEAREIEHKQEEITKPVVEEQEQEQEQPQQVDNEGKEAIDNDNDINDNNKVEDDDNNNNIDTINLDNQSPEELHRIYETYQDRFKSSITESQKIFESLQNQMFTLSYYHRRNQTLLTQLEELENSQKENQNVNDDVIEGEDLMNRLQNIFEKMPRCKDSLIPFRKLFDKGHKIGKNELLNLYLIEKVPDLVNDDLVKLQLNPQSIENWCIRNNPNLIYVNYKPIAIDNLQDYSNGTDYLLNLNDDFLSNQPSSNRHKKRKLEKK